jgi:hypothetical protein
MTKEPNVSETNYGNKAMAYRIQEQAKHHPACDWIAVQIERALDEKDEDAKRWAGQSEKVLDDCLNAMQKELEKERARAEAYREVAARHVIFTNGPCSHEAQKYINVDAEAQKLLSEKRGGQS